MSFNYRQTDAYVKTIPSAKLSQEGCDILVNAAIERAKELNQIVSIALSMPEVI